MRWNVASDNEVNKIITVFIGLSYVKLCDEEFYIQDKKYNILPLYTKSLDALVPVWNKLGGGTVKMNRNTSRYQQDAITIGFSNFNIGRSSTNKTIQQAAAHATAKVILELKEIREYEVECDE
jgi:hypothetical protein